MLGCKNYSRVELDHCKAAVEQQLVSYKTLVKAVADGGAGEVGTALEAFEVQSINNMTFVLDRYFVHRLRMVTGKDGNPLNEVEMLSDSLMNNDGVLRGINVIKRERYSKPTQRPRAPYASESLHQFPVLIPSHWTG